MTMMTKPWARSTLLGSFLKPIQEWLTPRAKERDKAFRERGLRLALALILSLGLLSVILTISSYREAWSVISVPTIQIYALLLCGAAAVAVQRGNLNIGGFLFIGGLYIGVFGLVILSRGENIERYLISIPLILVPVIVGALILPRSALVWMTFGSMSVFGVINIQSPITDPILASSLFTTFSLVLVVAGLLLYFLRTEFDRRLDVLADALGNAETARQRAELADRSKLQFLANMSHELRTPLNAVIGYDEAMLGGMVGSLSDEQMRVLGHIQVNSRRLLNLINDVLDLSKIEAGALETFFTPMSPRKVIEETADALRGLSQQKKIDFTVTFTPDVPEVVLCDVRKLQQIVTNLVGNAVKFTSVGGVTVQVDAPDTDHWRLSVQDTGIGIAEHDLKTIFEPFRQIDNSDTRRYHGTGLGLAIVSRLVTSLEGNIVVRSVVGKGSQFIATFPRAPIPTAELAPVPVKDAEPVQQGELT